MAEPGNWERTFSARPADQAEGVTRPLLEKIGVSADALRSRLETELAGRPKVSGGVSDLRISNDLRRTPRLR